MITSSDEDDDDDDDDDDADDAASASLFVHSLLYPRPPSPRSFLASFSSAPSPVVPGALR